MLVDKADAPSRFLILGSASPALLRQSSESLAGRLEFVEMAGFSLAEVGEEAATSLWLRGGFPRSFLADSEEASLIWRRDFIRTLLESDIPQLEVRVPAATLQRFWAMLAHFHGQLWNGAELGRSLGVNQTTCRRYLDLLEGEFMLRHPRLGRLLGGLARLLLVTPGERSCRLNDRAQVLSLAEALGSAGPRP